jgi:hypothetical protein
MSKKKILRFMRVGGKKKQNRESLNKCSAFGFAGEHAMRACGQ